MNKTSGLILLSLIALSACHVTISELQLQAPTIREDIIDYVNNEANSTWTAGPNERFRNMSLKQFSGLLGALKTPRKVLETEMPLMVFTVAGDLPEEYDTRKAFPQCQSLQEVRDQSACGSCWAFGAAEVMSDRICIQSKGTLQTRISTEDLVSCCVTCGFGCNGGYPFSAFKYWESSGVVTGGLYGDTSTCQPYAYPPCEHHTTGKYQPCQSGEFPTPKCSKTCQSGYPKTYTQDKLHGSAYRLGSDEQAIMADIFKNGPVEGAFSVYEDFPNYKSGVYQHKTGSFLGGHAIKIAGWGVENGVKYWLCVNSWNEDWGDNGTFKILRGTNECGIEDEIVAGNPKFSGMKFLEDQ